MVFHGTCTNTALSARSLPEKACRHSIYTDYEGLKLWPSAGEGASLKIANIKKGAQGAQKGVAREQKQRMELYKRIEL